MSWTNTAAVCFEKSNHHLPHIEYNKLLDGASILAKPGYSSSRSCYSWFKYWPGPLTSPVGWTEGEVEMRYDFEVHQKTGSTPTFQAGWRKGPWPLPAAYTLLLEYLEWWLVSGEGMPIRFSLPGFWFSNPCPHSWRLSGLGEGWKWLLGGGLLWCRHILAIVYSHRMIISASAWLMGRNRSTPLPTWSATLPPMRRVYKWGCSQCSLGRFYAHSCAPGSHCIQ